MNRVQSLKYFGYLIIAIALGMCIYSFILSEYMAIKSVLNTDRLAMAVGGKGSLTFSEVASKRYSNTHPFIWVYMLVSLGVYLWPAVGVLILNRWVYLQISMLLPIYYLLQYDITSLNGSYAEMANGCEKCEIHGFNHLLGAGAILVGSVILYFFASIIEKHYSTQGRAINGAASHFRRRL